LVHEEIPAIKDCKIKGKAFSQAERKLARASKAKKALNIETRLVMDIKARKRCEKQYARLGDELSNLQADLAALEQDFEREQLMQVSRGATNSDEIDEEDGQTAGDQMLREADNLQDQTQSSLQNTRKMVDEAIEVGMSSLEELKRQRGTMDEIGKKTTQIDSALDVAVKLIKNFGKRIVRDRFIQCIAVFNILLLVGVIIYASVTGKS